MKPKFKKIITIIITIGLIFISLGYISYKVYFEKLYLFKDNEKAFLNSIIEYYNINKTFVPEKGEYKTLTLQQMYDKQLIEALKIPKSSKFCDEKNSFVRTINDNGNIKFITYLKCGKFSSKIDHESPKIVLNGDDKIIVNLYDKYTEPGIKTVVDNEDGVINNNEVEIIGNVDTEKPGNYEITYKVSDSNFNVTRMTRTVVVADNLNNIIKRDTNGSNIYKGLFENNYLYFSGMLFRLVKINEDETVKIVSEDNISHISYTEDGYENSNVRKWLNNYYYDHINNESKKIIADGKWCVNYIENIDNFTCNNKVTDKIGLLNTQEYLESLDNDTSYLNGTNKNTLLLNKKNKGNYYVSGIRDRVATYMIHNGYPSVRPVLNLKENTLVLSGKGTKEEPYMLGDFERGTENDLLKDRLIGEYVNYSGYLTRISDKLQNGNIKLTFMEELENKKISGAKEKVIILPENIKTTHFNPDNKDSIAYLLNNKYIDYLNGKYLVKDEIKIPKTSLYEKYDEFKTDLTSVKISLPSTYQMFASDYANSSGYMVSKYIYIDQSNNGTLFVANPNNQVCFELGKDFFDYYTIRPVITVSKQAKIRSGNGTSEKPYILK